jgi:hypothetical protein
MRVTTTSIGTCLRIQRLLINGDGLDLNPFRQLRTFRIACDSEVNQGHFKVSA